MENKIYLLIIRDNIGVFAKQKVFCNIEEARFILKCMLLGNKYTRGDIIEGDRTHVGDFSVRPIEQYVMDKEGNMNPKDNYASN